MRQGQDRQCEHCREIADLSFEGVHIIQASPFHIFQYKIHSVELFTVAKVHFGLWIPPYCASNLPHLQLISLRSTPSNSQSQSFPGIYTLITDSSPSSTCKLQVQCRLVQVQLILLYTFLQISHKYVEQRKLCDGSKEKSLKKFSRKCILWPSSRNICLFLTLSVCLSVCYLYSPQSPPQSASNYPSLSLLHLTTRNSGRAHIDV